MSGADETAEVEPWHERKKTGMAWAHFVYTDDDRLPKQSAKSGSKFHKVKVRESEK